MQVQRIDHVEFYVDDADQAAAQLCASYGFQIAGRLRPEAGDHHSILLRQRDIQILVTAGLAPEHPAAEYVRRHGDGLATVALATDDPVEAMTEAVFRGAVPLPPAVPDGPVSATNQVRIGAFGDVSHTFVRAGELAALVGAPQPAGVEGGLDLLDAIDHVAACVPAGELDAITGFYERVLGFEQIFEEFIEVGEQGMNSKVVQSPSGEVTLTLLEPDSQHVPGQIDEFLAKHVGAGVQHVAFRTGDIATAVRTLAERGVGFLSTPGSYYDELERRLGHVGIPLDTLRELNVLVDRDEAGELFQIFAQSTHPRRTFFFEVIERLGARTFGSANIKALYQAVERERARASAGIAG
ncbi:MAG: 4-hydroxymandelate synthase [Mycobacteriales bacterium]|jgi:4-hydroxymandelate synthase